MTLPSSPASSAALVVAHPGHELRVHGWVERMQPLVLVLTDGSGGAGTSRLASTRHLLDRLGARPGGVFGRFTDREIYRLLLDGETARFVALAEEIADELVAARAEVVAADAAEAYNPVHDVCRLLTDAAVALARRRSGRAIAAYQFALVGRPDAAIGEPTGALHLELDEAALARKLAAASEYPELRLEVEAALAAHGAAPFSHEWLVPAAGGDPAPDAVGAVPFYESYGERMVAAGRYRELIRYADHVLPVARALARCVATVAPGERSPSAG